jgi:hypothetical protein
MRKSGENNAKFSERNCDPLDQKLMISCLVSKVNPHDECRRKESLSLLRCR